MARYITNGVLVGLHYHKVGQYRSLERVTCISLALLIVVVIACLIRMGDGGQRVDESNHVEQTPRFRTGFFYSPSSSPHFASGYIGQVRIVRDDPVPIVPFVELPASIVFDSCLAPEGFESLVDFPAGSRVGDPAGSLSFDPDFGLLDPIPMWRFSLRRLPDGIVQEQIRLPIDKRQPHVMLVSPAWPPRVWLVDDTAVVEGYLTMHSYGLLSFELLCETHPKLGFAAAVRTAVEHGQCIPARDSLDNRITVQVRYRCLFFDSAESSISITGSITARLKEIPRSK